MAQKLVAPFKNFEEMWKSVGAKLLADDPHRAAQVVWLYAQAATYAEAQEMANEAFGVVKAALAERHHA